MATAAARQDEETLAGELARRRGRLPLVLFALTMFLSAGLVFLVQPMYAKFVLPRFGGTPAVWIGSMLFFQAALLAGYVYAHATTRRLGARRQAALHIGVLLLPILFLPLAVPEGAAARGEGNPLPGLLALLTISVGIPFFVVSTTAPLLQRWLSAMDHPAAEDPYFLYRASNLGSAIGLLAYPLALEPSLRLAEQGRVWAIAYGALVVLMAGCAAVLWRAPVRAAAVREGERPGAAPPGEADGPGAGDRAAAPPPPEAAPRTAPVTPGRRLRWVALAFVPSSLMLGVTSFITTDLAPVPLLWAIPLALYLASFVAVFARGRSAERWDRAARLGFPVLAIVVALVLVLQAQRPIWALVPLHLLTFFAAAVLCHGRLARDRPAAESLTEFYLWLAVGGMLGGIFNALVAPVVLNSLSEYPLVLALACLALPLRPRFPATPLAPWLDVLAPVAVGGLVAGALYGATVVDAGQQEAVTAVGVGVAVGVMLNLARRPQRFGLAIAAVLFAGSLNVDPDERVLFQDRSFFGVNRVIADRDGTQRLLNGTTNHGAQDRTPPARARTPITYYHRSGPVGQIMGAVPRRGPGLSAAVVGLGTGTMACHSRAGERWTFYEIDPVVERIARDPRLFTYLRDCPGRFDVVLGDARLSLRRSPPARLELMVVDAFSSDSIPVHLLTRQAVELYRSRLAAGGLLAVHISNRYVELEPVLGDIARATGMACVAQRDTSRDGQTAEGKTGSHWVTLARRPEELGDLRRDLRWHPCERGNRRVWTDDYSNLVSALQLR